MSEWIVYIAIGVLVYFKPKIDAWLKKRKVSISRSVFIIEQIDNHCYYLSGLLGAKRVSVWQFGNGDTSFMGFSFKYASMVGEAVRSEQKSLRNESQKIPIYDYVPILAQLKEREGVFEYQTNSLKGKNAYHILTSLDIISSAECKLNPNRIEDGFISIAFDTDRMLNLQEESEVERVAYEIYSLLKQEAK